jgi:hypothetical protein
VPLQSSFTRIPPFLIKLKLLSFWSWYSSFGARAILFVSTAHKKTKTKNARIWSDDAGVGVIMSFMGIIVVGNIAYSVHLIRVKHRVIQNPPPIRSTPPISLDPHVYCFL